MAYIKTKLQTPAFVQVPTWFIKDYMPKALSGYTKVYLYLLTLTASNNQEAIDLEEVSSKLGMLHSELIQALKFWNQEKVICFKEGSDESFELEFMMSDPALLKKAAADAHSLPINKTIIKQTRPEYRPEEITLYVHDSQEVARLFKLAERYLGRLLTISDQKILFGLYDWLHMPFDLIEYLIEYCAGNNNRISTRYIEQVAINWVDEGIVTVEQAKAKAFSDKRYFKILNALGSSKATLTPVEKEFISKWLDTYQFSMDIILEACRRAVMNTNQPSLKYVDSILSKWQQDKVKTLEDIKMLDQAFESKKMQQASFKNTSSPALSNKIAKFNSMYAHDWDFDELEKLEEEHLNKELNGGH